MSKLSLSGETMETPPGYCDCEVFVPHAPQYHDKVVNALKENPSQHFIIKEGVVYLVEPEDIINDLTDTESTL